MRRQTMFVIVALFVVIIAAGVAQLLVASGDGDPLPGPASPGQLPSATATPAAS